MSRNLTVITCLKGLGKVVVSGNCHSSLILPAFIHFGIAVCSTFFVDFSGQLYSKPDDRTAEGNSSHCSPICWPISGTGKNIFFWKSLNLGCLKLKEVKLKQATLRMTLPPIVNLSIVTLFLYTNRN